MKGLVVVVRICHILTTFIAIFWTLITCREDAKLNLVTLGNLEIEGTLNTICSFHHRCLLLFRPLLLNLRIYYMNIVYTWWFKIITCNISNRNETQRVGVVNVNLTWQFFHLQSYMTILLYLQVWIIRLYNNDCPRYQ